MRGPIRKKFNGHWFDRVGSSITKSKMKAQNWADFQRRNNRLMARVVPVSGGYEIYVCPIHVSQRRK